MFRFNFRSFTALIGLTAALAVTPVKSAFAGCLEDGAEAAAACKSDDIAAGMNGWQANAMEQLVARAKATNELVDPTKMKQAAQCKNRAYQSKILSALSSLKSQACSQALTKCVSSCASNPLFAPYAAACQTLTADARLAAQQSQKLMNDMVQNMECWNGSSADLAAPVGGNGPAETCALNDVACQCRQDPSLTKCNQENRRQADSGEDDVGGSGVKRKHAGNFDPKGFSGGEYKGGSNHFDSNGNQAGDPNAKDAQKNASAAGPAAGGVGGATGAGQGYAGPNAAARAIIAVGVRQPASVNGKDRDQGKKHKDGTWAFGAGGLGGGGDVGGDESGESADSGGAGNDSRLSGKNRRKRDGITGAMGPSLFEKVSKQYQTQRGTMLAD